MVSTIKKKVKMIVSTKAVILEEKVNNAIEELQKEGWYIDMVDSNISYHGDQGYQILATITCAREDLWNEDDDPDFGYCTDSREPLMADQISEA